MSLFYNLTLMRLKKWLFISSICWIQVLQLPKNCRWNSNITMYVKKDLEHRNNYCKNYNDINYKQ